MPKAKRAVRGTRARHDVSKASDIGRRGLAALDTRWPAPFATSRVTRADATARKGGHLADALLAVLADRQAAHARLEDAVCACVATVANSSARRDALERVESAADERGMIDHYIARHTDARGRINVPALAEAVEAERLRVAGALLARHFHRELERVEPDGSDLALEQLAQLRALEYLIHDCEVVNAFEAAGLLRPPSNEARWEWFLAIDAHTGAMAAMRHPSIAEHRREGHGVKRAACLAAQILLTRVAGRRAPHWKTIENAYNAMTNASTATAR